MTVRSVHVGYMLNADYSLRYPIEVFVQIAARYCSSLSASFRPA